MKITAISLAALLSITTALAWQAPFERGRHRRAQKFDELQSLMGLSEQQIDDLKAVQQAFREAVRPTMQEALEKRRELRDENRSDDPNTAKIEQLEAERQSLNDEIKATAAQYRVEAQNVLTDRQKEVLNTLHDAMALQGAVRQALGLNLLEGNDGGRGGFGGFRRGRRGRSGPLPEGGRGGPPIP